MKKNQREKESRRTPRRRRNAFPESNRLLPQLRILSRALLPFLGACVSRFFWWMGARWTQFYAQLLNRRERMRLPAAMFLTASILIAAAAVFVSVFTLGTTVTYDGNELGTVPTEAAAATAISVVEDELSDVLGDSFTLDMSKVSYSTGIVPRREVVDETAIETTLNDQLDLVTYGYSLYVDGELIGSTRSREALEALLEQVKAPYLNENTQVIDFLEPVEIVEGYLPNESICNLGDIVLKINETKEGEVTHVVEAGETWSQIAQDYNISSKDLEALNPGFDINRLQIGDELTISNAVPYLTIQVTQWEYYEAEIPFEIEYIDDASMWEGDTSVVKKGVYGIADTTALVTYVNSEETKREITEQTVISEPEAAVYRRGTAPRPSWAPTGSFRWPTNGNISSYYGWRNIFGGRSFHGGLDIYNGYGTDIVAADGGIVKTAGWSGAYGYLVVIDHQNGYQTYYGHNSSLLVSVGQKVHKGQHIAEMGATGRVTGTHCHFEVRYNGERQNPLNYLP